MTKEEALMTIQAIPESFWEKLSDTENEAVEMAVNALKGQMWIPCSERLPEEDGEYLCTRYFKYSERSIVEVLSFANDLYKQDQYDFCEYDGLKKSGFNKYDSEYGYYEVDDVVAWMPLPEAYNSNIN